MAGQRSSRPCAVCPLQDFLDYPRMGSMQRYVPTEHLVRCCVIHRRTRTSDVTAVSSTGTDFFRIGLRECRGHRYIIMFMASRDHPFDRDITNGSPRTPSSGLNLWHPRSGRRCCNPWHNPSSRSRHPPHRGWRTCRTSRSALCPSRRTTCPPP